MFEGLVAIGMTICVVCLVGIGLTAGYLTFMGEALVQLFTKYFPSSGSYFGDFFGLEGFTYGLISSANSLGSVSLKTSPNDIYL